MLAKTCYSPTGIVFLRLQLVSAIVFVINPTVVLFNVPCIMLLLDLSLPYCVLALLVISFRDLYVTKFWSCTFVIKSSRS